MPAKIAYAQWPWGTGSREEFIQSCKDLSEVGYHYFESVKAFIDTFSAEPEEFKKLCREYDLVPCSFYFHLTGDYETDVNELLGKIGFVADNGIRTITIQGTWDSTPATAEDLKRETSIVNAYGKICKPYGIIPCVHPHHNTHIMTESDIDYVMQNTNPDEVGLAPDTAHLIAANCNPYTIFERYIDRVKFMHLKDIYGAMASGGMQAGVEVYSNFRELGEGVVDFPSIFALLKKVNYDGYLCIELDGSRTSNKESAAMSLEYMKKNW